MSQKLLQMSQIQKMEGRISAFRGPPSGPPRGPPDIGFLAKIWPPEPFPGQELKYALFPYKVRARYPFARICRIWPVFRLRRLFSASRPLQTALDSLQTTSSSQICPLRRSPTSDSIIRREVRPTSLIPSKLYIHRTQ